MEQHGNSAISMLCCRPKWLRAYLIPVLFNRTNWKLWVKCTCTSPMSVANNGFTWCYETGPLATFWQRLALHENPTAYRSFFDFTLQWMMLAVLQTKVIGIRYNVGWRQLCYLTLSLVSGMWSANEARRVTNMVRGRAKDNGWTTKYSRIETLKSGIGDSE